MNCTDSELTTLCEQHKGLLITIVNRHRFRFPSDMYTFDDIEQIAWIGVLIGLKTFKPEMGTRLDSWLGRAIESKLSRELDYLYMQMRDIRVPLLSMDAKHGHTEKPYTLHDALPDNRFTIVDEPILWEQALSLLKGRDRDILTMKMQGMRGEDIARQYGISRQRVKQIWTVIENKLKKMWKI